MSNTCLTCKFWVWNTLNDDLNSITQLEDGNWGQCKRYAPKALVLANPQEGQEKFRTDTLWPETSASDGCGDYEEDAERTEELEEHAVKLQDAPDDPDEYENTDEDPEKDDEEEEEDDLPEGCLAVCKALDGKMERLFLGSEPEEKGKEDETVQI